ncbi:MAG: metallophosphoesterase [Pseudomonadota bacterium]
MITRRALLRVLAGLGLAGAATGGYAGWVVPGAQPVIARYRPALPGWPGELTLRIAAIADVHIGPPAMPRDRVAEIVAAANALAPDLIVLLGDYVATHRFQRARIPVGDFAAEAAALRAPLGVYAVMGNHDWRDDAAAQRRRAGPIAGALALQEAGIAVLENEARRIQAPGGAFWLAGLGDQWAFGHPVRGRTRGVDDLPGTLAQIDDDAPVLLLAHEPDIFPRVPARVALTLSGHTHGGQIRVLGYAPVVPSLYGRRYAHGHIVEDGRHLIVSAGLGCSGVPLRFGIPPEIVLVDLGAPARTRIKAARAPARDTA